MQGGDVGEASPAVAVAPFADWPGAVVLDPEGGEPAYSKADPGAYAGNQDERGVADDWRTRPRRRSAR